MLTIIGLIIFGALLYKLFLSNPYKDYWKKYGVREIDTSSAVSTLDIFLGRKSIFHADDYAYQRMELFSDKFCGVMEMGKPAIIVKDIELVKKVLIKDFNYFVDRRDLFTAEEGSLSKMLPGLKGDEWKGVRAAVTPTFTSGKIKKMMDYFNGVGKEWVAELTSQARANSGSIKVDVGDSVNRYTIDVIASTVFGLNAGTIQNPKSTFSLMATRLADMNTWQLMKFALKLQFPTLYSLLRLKLLDGEALAYFSAILDEGLKARMNGDLRRNDFLQLLVEAKKGELEGVGSDELSAFEKQAELTGVSQDKKQFLTDEVMNAQSVVFFFAGFSTTSNFITLVLYALALHQDVQTRLRAEVNKIVKEDGTLDYDDVSQLVYLDMVLCEIFRKYPVAGRLERKCIREYQDKETGLVIPKDTTVIIPLNGIHHDKRFYDNPQEFDPEHFTPEKKLNRNPYAFMPFGMGPRNCIGMRFAMIESKSAVAHLVHNFYIEPTEKTPNPFQGKPAGLQVMAPKGLELKLTPIKN